MNTLLGLGTDGFTNWVQTPDGCKFNLGPVSVLQFVSKIVPNKSAQKEVLNEFNKNGQALLSGDLDLVWEILKPRKSKWAAFPFMPRDTQREHMSTFLADLTTLEHRIVELNKHASSAKGLSPEKLAASCAPFVEIVVQAAEKIKSAGTAKNPKDQSKNDAYYNLGEPKTDKSAGTEKAPSDQSKNDAYYNLGEPSVETKLAYDTYADNSKVVASILAKAEETDSRIDTLVKAGKKFNADKARKDLHAVTSKVAGIVSEVDLTLPWVQSDLQKLAARNDEIHKLFSGVKIAKVASTLPEPQDPSKGYARGEIEKIFLQANTSPSTASELSDAVWDLAQKAKGRLANDYSNLADALNEQRHLLIALRDGDLKRQIGHSKRVGELLNKLPGMQ
jgi:hypothetical protein